MGSDSTLTPISSSASSATCLYTPPAVGGVGGTFSTIGTYSGDGSYATSAGSLAQEVLGTLAIVGTTVFSANPSPNGAPVTMNGTLTDTSSTANPATAAGAFPATVTVFDQGTGAVLCTNVALSPTGTYTAGFSCPFTPIGPGQTLILRAVYSGDDTFAPSSGSSTLVVAGTASTTPSVVASASTVAVGASTTLQAALTGSPAPTGNVTFLDDGTPISGCGRIVVQSGVAQSKCAYSPASVGSHSITVTYSGDINYAAAGPSAAATVIVTGTTTSVTATPTLVSPSAPVPNGDPITVSTVVSGSGATPTGTVAFSATIGSSTSTPCATAPVDGSGMASCTFTPAFAVGAVGDVSITAPYSGDDTYSQSTSGALSVNVLAIGLPSTFTLTTSQSPMSVILCRMQPRSPLRVAVLPRNSQSMELSSPDQRMIIHPVRRRGPPEKFSPTARANAGSAMLHLRRSTGGGDALPFAIRHLHPSVHPAFMGINCLTVAVRPFALPRTASDRRVPKRGRP